MFSFFKCARKLSRSSRTNSSFTQQRLDDERDLAELVVLVGGRDDDVNCRNRMTTTPSWTGQLIFSPAMLKKEWFPLSSRSKVAPIGGGTGSLLWSGAKSRLAARATSESRIAGVIWSPQAVAVWSPCRVFLARPSCNNRRQGQDDGESTTPERLLVGPFGGVAWASVSYTLPTTADPRSDGSFGTRSPMRRHLLTVGPSVRLPPSMPYTDVGQASQAGTGTG